MTRESIVADLLSLPVDDALHAIEAVRTSLLNRLKTGRLDLGGTASGVDPHFREAKLAYSLQPAPFLQRDGVPSPEVYSSQQHRTVFVFKEPNAPKMTCDLDLVEEVQEIVQGIREPNSWWSHRVALFAHAASHLGLESWQDACSDFVDKGGVSHLLNCGYLQLKKSGGSGTSHAPELQKHAQDYGWLLRRQLEAYRPSIVVGCGKSAPPAVYLKAHVLTDAIDDEGVLPSGMPWWSGAWDCGGRFVLVSAFHPSARGKSDELLYETLHSDLRSAAKMLNS